GRNVLPASEPGPLTPTEAVAIMSGGGLQDRPGHLFPVELAMPEAAMQNAHQPVAQSPQRLPVRLAPAPQLSVVAAGARRARDGRERPQVAAVGQPPVAHETGQHHLALPRLPGDGRGPGAVLARLSIDVASLVVAELTQNPGAEDVAESRQTEVDLGVRVHLEAVL